MIETTVGAIITKETNGQLQILLTKRNTELFKGRWCLPGGHIEPKENAKDAIIREVNEETGLDYECKFYNYFDEIIPEMDIHATVLIFIGKVSGNIIVQESEVSEIKWFYLPEIFSLDLAFYHKNILNVFIKDNSFTDETLIHNEILEEFKCLRDEALKRVEIRTQLIYYTLLVAGTFLTFSSSKLNDAQYTFFDFAGLLFPILAMFLASSWSNHDIRIHEIGLYIKQNIESKLKNINWENYLSNNYYLLRKGIHRRLFEISTLGVFLLTQVLSISISLPKLITHGFYPANFKFLPLLLIVLDLVCILFTYFIVVSCRKKYRKKLKFGLLKT